MKNKFIIISLIIMTAVMILSSCRDETIPITPIVIGSGCDTTNVSYTSIVKPLLNDCLSCHNNSSSYAGINLEGYENAAKVAGSGKLLSSLRGTMKGFFSGTDCNYAKIQAWINQGFKNN